ncbi:hypothetical protein SAY87_014249 [Trapa incisa]|uniref:Uncharacterized protein n=1 Tax=Trapa incisa TaxID=236973 RepID=A0AAN7GVB2_9MYRT|nr:hypothetical protein SAY87_014249 [Trapa incisa]
MRKIPFRGFNLQVIRRACFISHGFYVALLDPDSEQSLIPSRMLPLSFRSVAGRVVSLQLDLFTLRLGLGGIFSFNASENRLLLRLLDREGQLTLRGLASCVTNFIIGKISTWEKSVA